MSFVFVPKAWLASPPEDRRPYATMEALEKDHPALKRHQIIRSVYAGPVTAEFLRLPEAQALPSSESPSVSVKSSKKSKYKSAK